MLLVWAQPANALADESQQPAHRCRYKLEEAHVRAHVERMLEAVNLPGFARRQTHTLSGGQKQRVAIAGALAECPKVWCLQPAHQGTAGQQANL